VKVKVEVKRFIGSETRPETQGENVAVDVLSAKEDGKQQSDVDRE
jgi:hypothetical protein